MIFLLGTARFLPNHVVLVRIESQEELNHEDLKEVFKQTSLFTVESALQDEEPPLYEQANVIDYEEDEDGNFFFFGALFTYSKLTPQIKTH